MKGQGNRCVIGKLVEATMLQEDFAQQGFVLEWGQLTIAKLVQVRDHLETHESLAYENKAQVEVRLLEEVPPCCGASIKRLYKPGVCFNNISSTCDARSL